MKIYYPYFEIENLTGKIFDHKLYINTLLLLSDSIVIPPSHIFDFRNPGILKAYDEYFERNYLISSIGRNQRDMMDFYQNKQNEDLLSGIKWSQDKINNARAITSVFGKNKILIARDIKKQSEIFKHNVDLIFSINNWCMRKIIQSNSDTYEDIIKRYTLALDKKGYALSKIDLDNILKRHDRKSGNISILRNQVQQQYFYAGGIGNSAIVAWVDVFSKTRNRKIELDSINGSSILYDPLVFLNSLLTLGIINEIREITNLSTEDIERIKSTEEYRMFIHAYHSLSYTINHCKEYDDLDFVKNIFIKEVISENKNRESTISSINNSINIGIGVLSQPFWMWLKILKGNIAAQALGIVATIGFAISIAQTTNTWEDKLLLPGVERIQKNIAGNSFSFSKYVEILSRIINENRRTIAST